MSSALRQTDLSGTFTPQMPSDWQWSLTWNLLWGGISMLTMAFLRMPGHAVSRRTGLVVALLVIVPQMGLRPRLFLETAPASYLNPPSTVTWLKQNAPSARFIEHRPSMTSASHVDSPFLTPHAVHRLPEWFGVHSAYGYDPLYPRLYGKLLHTAGGIGHQSGVTRNVRMENLPAHLLRRLGIRYVIGDPYERSSTTYFELRSGEEKTLTFERPVSIDRLWLRHHLRGAETLKQDAVVGTVNIEAADGMQAILTVRAGVEIANAILEFPDSKAAHAPAKTIRFWTIPMPGTRTPLRQYAANWELPQSLEAERITFKATLPTGTWTVFETAFSLEDGDEYKRAFRDGFDEIYEVQGALGPASAIHAMSAYDSVDEIVEKIIDQESDPHEMFLSMDPEIEMPESADYAPVEIRSIRRGVDSLQIETSAEGDSAIRIIENWNPWWKACIDGKPARLIRADLTFMALELPGGEHAVELNYRPLPLYLGILLSLLGILLCLLIMIIRFRVSSADKCNRIGMRETDGSTESRPPTQSPPNTGRDSVEPQSTN